MPVIFSARVTPNPTASKAAATAEVRYRRDGEDTLHVEPVGSEVVVAPSSVAAKDDVRHAFGLVFTRTSGAAGGACEVVWRLGSATEKTIVFV